MQRVVIESPFGNDDQQIVEKNKEYLRRAMHDSITKYGEAPFASHAIYTQDGVLDDNIPEERELGIKAGFIWGEQADVRIFYMDRGMSEGMKYGLKEAIDLNQPIIFRWLDTTTPNQTISDWDLHSIDVITKLYGLDNL